MGNDIVLPKYNQVKEKNKIKLKEYVQCKLDDVTEACDFWFEQLKAPYTINAALFDEIFGPLLKDTSEHYDVYHPKNSSLDIYTTDVFCMLAILSLDSVASKLNSICSLRSWKLYLLMAHLLTCLIASSEEQDIY